MRANRRLLASTSLHKKDPCMPEHQRSNDHMNKKEDRVKDCKHWRNNDDLEYSCWLISSVASYSFAVLTVAASGSLIGPSSGDWGSAGRAPAS